MILNVDFVLKLSNYTPLTFYMSQINRKKCHHNTIFSVQLPVIALSVTPFTEIITRI